MELGQLRVLHLEKTIYPPFDAANVVPKLGAFCVETCLRKIWIYSAENKGFEATTVALQSLSGSSAYGFLLRVASGLESLIIGETDIFGQIKSAWSAFESTRSRQVHCLRPWIQKLFEDTKEIRSRYIQGLGGTSYGALVRRVLKPTADDTILLVGAGQLARSIAPYLLDSNLLISNRSSGALLGLEGELREKSIGKSIRLEVLSDPKKEMSAWINATHVVVSVPRDEVKDPERIGLRQLGQSSRVARSMTLHLGCLKHEAGQWKNLSGFWALDEFFGLQKAQDQARSIQIQRARKACQERAILRSMSRSLSVAQSWEDLAAFI